MIWTAAICDAISNWCDAESYGSGVTLQRPGTAVIYLSGAIPLMTSVCLPAHPCNKYPSTGPPPTARPGSALQTNAIRPVLRTDKEEGRCSIVWGPLKRHQTSGNVTGGSAIKHLATSQLYGKKKGEKEDEKEEGVPEYTSTGMNKNIHIIYTTHAHF